MRRATWVLFKKELREFLRDKRALFFTLFMPILAMPLAFGAVFYGTWLAKHSLANETLAASVESSALLEALQGQALKHTPLDIQAREEALEALAKKARWAFVETEGAFEDDDIDTTAKLRLYYSRQQERSKEAKARLKEALDAISQERLEARFEKQALSKAFAKPMEVEEIDVAAQSPWLEILAVLVSFCLVNTLFLTSANLATDLVTGEKERGTLETLLSAPLFPKQVLRAKQGVISLCALLSAFLNLAIFIGLLACAAWFFPETQWHFSFRWGQLIFLGLCFVPAAFLAASLCIALASLARTLKASQTSTSMAALAALMASSVVVFPGMELSWLLAWLPLVNLALLAKACIFGTLEYGPAAITLGVTGLLAVLLEKSSARIFLDEQNVFGAPAKEGPK